MKNMFSKIRKNHASQEDKAETFKSAPGSRRKSRFNLRVKLPVVVIGFLVLAFLGLTVLSVRVSKSTLIRTLQSNLQTEASLQAESIRSHLTWTRSMAIDLSTVAESVSLDEETSKHAIAQMLSQNEQVIGSTIAYEPYQFKPDVRYWAPYYNRTANGALQFTQLGTPENNYPAQDWYKLAKQANGIILSPPYFDVGGAKIWMVTWSVPFHDVSGKLKGVATTDIAFSQTQDIVRQIAVGKRGYAFLIDKDGVILGIGDQGGQHNIMEDQLMVSNPSKQGISWNHVIKQMINGESGFANVVDPQGNPMFVAYQPVGLNTGWSLGLAYHQEELFQPAVQLQTKLVLLSVIVLFLASVILLFFSRSITRPLQEITSWARLISQRENNPAIYQAVSPLNIHTNDEIEDLGETFNQMSQELTQAFSTLEQRVADRTRNLELAADVGRSVSQVRDLDIMLKDAAEIIRSRFDLYYVQVYLTNPSRTALIIKAGTGAAGQQLLARGHQLALNRNSINGRAAVEKQSVVISETAASTSFHPNPLLPDTQSEMAVPLIIGEKVVGVLDMQSARAGALSQENLVAFEALAAQLAVAIQNANLLAETVQARAELEAQAKRLSRANWADYLDAIEKPEEIGFVFQQDRLMPLTEDLEPKENALVALVSILGENLGNLVVQLDGQSPTADTKELLDAVAGQVAIQIEQLRLIDSADRYRLEAEEASRRLTREGWKAFASNTEETLRYVYDLKEVHPLDDSERQVDGYALPIKVRDEAIGKLVIPSLEEDDTKSTNIANAVAERLATHIESLRQFDQTQSALVQSEKLFQASSRLTQATDLQELVAAVVTTLEIPAANRALLTTFEYGPSGDIEQLTIVGNWWNGTGHEVTSIGTLYSRDVMRVMPMFISPTPVFFNDVFHDERVDPTTMELIAKRLNLRSVAVLPLYSVNKQIGALVLEGEEPHKFTQQEIRLFSSLAPQIATIMENRRQYEETQLARAQSEKLFNASQGLTQAANLQELVATAVTTVGIPQVNRALLATFGYDAEGAITKMTVDANWWNGSGHGPTPVGTSYEREVFQNMQIYLSPTPLFSNDAALDERVDPITRERAKEQNIRAMAFLPLQVGGRQIGIVVLEAEETYNFTADETRLFSSLAPQIATVLENRRQFEQAQRQAQREATLNAINQKIQSATSVEAVLQIAARELGRALDASKAVAQLGVFKRNGGNGNHSNDRS